MEGRASPCLSLPISWGDARTHTGNHTTNTKTGNEKQQLHCRPCSDEERAPETAVSPSTERLVWSTVYWYEIKNCIFNTKKRYGTFSKTDFFMKDNQTCAFWASFGVFYAHMSSSNWWIFTNDNLKWLYDQGLRSRSVSYQNVTF